MAGADIDLAGWDACLWAIGGSSVGLDERLTPERRFILESANINWLGP